MSPGARWFLAYGTAAAGMATAVVMLFVDPLLTGPWGMIAILMLMLYDLDEHVRVLEGK